jgi:lipoate-protein ligase A
MTRSFRLLVTPPMSGPANMAVDEALLTSRLRGAGPPTIRFYGWNPATISLGYGQALDERIDLVAAAAAGIGLVRRSTGGSAILHGGPDTELTYSVVAMSEDLPTATDLHSTYHWIGAALASGLKSLGAPVEMVPTRPSDPAAMPAFCFLRTGSYELEVGGRKIVGSAQRRRRGGFLQHGSVMLAADEACLRRVFPSDEDPLAGMTTLETVLGHRPSFDETADALARGFRAAHQVELRPGGLDAEESELVSTLTRDKYATPSWTEAGRVEGSSRRPAFPQGVRDVAVPAEAARVTER